MFRRFEGTGGAGHSRRISVLYSDPYSESDKTSGTCYILCTGFSDLATEEQAKDWGLGDLVTKPVSVGTMAPTIRSVLNTAMQKDLCRMATIVVTDDDPWVCTLVRHVPEGSDHSRFPTPLRQRRDGGSRRSGFRTDDSSIRRFLSS